MATQTLTVTGEGGVTSGWADEGGDYTRVQSDDGDTTRLYTPTSGSTRTFAISDTSGLSGATINSVTVYAKVRNLNPIDSNNQLGVRISGVNYFSADKTNNGETYVLISHAMTTNPATGLAWTTSDIDSAEIAIRKNDAIGTGLTYMYAEVDYTSGGGFTPAQAAAFLAFF